MGLGGQIQGGNLRSSYLVNLVMMMAEKIKEKKQELEVGHSHTMWLGYVQCYNVMYMFVYSVLC